MIVSSLFLFPSLQGFWGFVFFPHPEMFVWKGVWCPTALWPCVAHCCPSQVLGLMLQASSKCLCRCIQGRRVCPAVLGVLTVARELLCPSRAEGLCWGGRFLPSLLTQKLLPGPCVTCDPAPASPPEPAGGRGTRHSLGCPACCRLWLYQTQSWGSTERSAGLILPWERPPCDPLQVGTVGISAD